MKVLTQAKHISVDYSKINGWKNIEEEALIATQVDNNVEILGAKQPELTSWINHVYEEVKDVGQKIVSGRWVILQKFKDKKMKYEACLVARGFEEEKKQR